MGGLPFKYLGLPVGVNPVSLLIGIHYCQRHLIIGGTSMLVLEVRLCL